MERPLLHQLISWRLREKRCGRTRSGRNRRGGQRQLKLRCWKRWRGISGGNRDEGRRITRHNMWR
jgi:hypothetical protein